MQKRFDSLGIYVLATVIVERKGKSDAVGNVALESQLNSINEFD